MASEALPSVPPQLKAIQTYMKIAQDVERVDPVVAYWMRLYSTETALKIDKETPECMTFLTTLIAWLENFKKSHKDSEAVTNQTVGQAHFENFAMALFNKADTLDRAGTANASTIRMFFMTAILFEAMAVFGSITDEISQRVKYAKFKAAYIQKCLKAGVTPKPGPIDNSDLEGTGANSDQQNPKSDSTASLSTSVAPENKTTDIPTDKTGDQHIFVPPADNSIRQPPLPRSIEFPHSAPAAAPKTTSTPADDQLSAIEASRFVATNGAPLKPEDITQGQKYCKFANSALQYDDIPTAVANLEKALKLLSTGQRSD